MTPRKTTGLGAAKLSHLRKVLREQRAQAAQRFLDVATDARVQDAALNCPKDTWTSLPLVQRARKQWLSALASDLYARAA